MAKDAADRVHADATPREAELLNLMAEMRPHVASIADAKALVKKLEKDYAVTRNKAEVLGFTLATLDKALKLEGQPTNRKGQQAAADEEYFVFKTLGLPVSQPQGQLDFGSDEERDAAYWGEQGYQAGIRGDIATPPDPCPPHFHQTWLTRRADGAEYSAWGKAQAGGKPDVREPATVASLEDARAAKEGAAAGGADGEGKGKGKGKPGPDPLLES
jgi:hypothetical protein